MYKLYLTLENEAGNKIERVMQINPETETAPILLDMIESMETPFDKDEGLKVEANRLTQHND